MEFKELRRKDRLLDAKGARLLLESGEYGFLALSDGDKGYGIPLNYALDENKIYFHCAPKGRKLDAIGKGSLASFCVVGRVHVLPSRFSTAYESVIAEGSIFLCDDENERIRALRLISQKYSPDFLESSEKYIADFKYRTAVLRLDILHITGKTNSAFK